MQTGVLKKMRFEYTTGVNSIAPRYFINLNDTSLAVNDLIGQRIHLVHTGKIICSSCGKTTKKSYGQGYCYPCFISVPQTEECVLKPELCRAHEGIARDMEFAKENCLVDQFVYLALSGGLKVGVTRHHQIPTRWVDQGASFAIKVATAPNRYNAGLIEVELKKIFADKTNWRKMLMGNDEPMDLVAQKMIAVEAINGKGFLFSIADDSVYSISYPVKEFPIKVNSISFDKQAEIIGTLLGIKGQYLIFDGGRVFNTRTHTGYEVNINI